MKFRYFDSGGQRLTMEQLHAMCVVTPAMDHVFATVLERLEKNESFEDHIEKRTFD